MFTTSDCYYSQLLFFSPELTKRASPKYKSNACKAKARDDANCKPSLTMVDAPPEIKDTLYDYYPIHYRVNRCSGDCSQKARKCVSTEEKTIKIKVSVYPKSRFILVIKNFIYLINRFKSKK